MAFILSDRVKETSATTGTGSVTLTGAYGGYQTFLAAIGDGNSTYYAIENDVRWEVGIGTYDSGTNSLSRDTVISSSNSGSKITLSGLSVVFCTHPASKSFIVNPDGYASGVSSSYVGIQFPDGSTQVTSASGLNSAPFLLKRSDAGNLLHMYVDNAYDKTITLHSESSSNPTWKLGMKDSPSSDTAAPEYGYVFGSNGTAGVYATSTNSILINNSNGAWVTHQGYNLLNIDKDNGVLFKNGVASTPAIIVRGAAAQSANLQTWQDSSQNTLGYFDSAGVISGVTVKAQNVHFADGTTQTTARQGVAAGDNVSLLTNDAGYLTAHPAVSTASGSTDFSGRTYIQNLFFDSFGHVSGVTVATETVADTDTTYTAGSGLTLDGTTFKVDPDGTVLESGRLISLLVNDAGYTANSGWNIYLDGVDQSKTVVNDNFVNFDAGDNVTITYLNSPAKGHNLVFNATQKTDEEIQDVVGAMFTGNTETNISATYQDGDGTIDLVSTDTTYSAGTGISLDGTTINSLTASTSVQGATTLTNTIADDATKALTPKAVHDAGYLTVHPSVTEGADISSDNANGVVIQDLSLTLDSHGHTTLSTVATVDLDGRYYTESELDAGALNSIYYTESELNTSGGGGQVHWDNVTNKPTIGDIASVTAGTGIAGGGTEGALTVDLDLNSLSEISAAWGDSIPIIDSDGSSKKTLLSSIATPLGTGILNSAALTGTPTAPTASSSTNSTQVATTAYVTTAVSNLVDGAPTALDTLNELAAAINDSGNYAAGITTLLSQKASSADLVTASGSLASGIHAVSGIWQQIPTVSGMLTSASGYLSSRLDAVTASGVGASGALRTDLTANTNLIYTSGNASTAYTVASGTAGIAYTVASGTAGIAYTVASGTAIRADLAGASGAATALTVASGTAGTAYTVASGTAGIAYTIASGTAAITHTNNASGYLNSDIQTAVASGLTASGYLAADIHAISGVGGLITTGISNNNYVVIDHAAVEDNDYARFTSNGIEGRSLGEITSDMASTGHIISDRTDVTATSDDYLLIWDATDSTLKKADAGEFLGGGGGGGGSVTTVKSNGSTVGGSDIVTLDFSSDFGVAETPDTEINITIGTLNQDTTGTAATVTGAAQTAITSVGTLTALQVDNININGNAITSTAGTDLTITPLAGQQIVLDGTIVIDAGVVTGATSITSTAFVGDITGDVTGNADTATALAAGRTIGMTGDVVWTSASFTGAGNVTGTSTIQALAVETGMIAADAITGAKIADDTIDSEHYAAGSIDEEHLNSTNSPTDNYLLSYDDSSGGFTWVAGGEANEFSFKTISVSGQDDVVADTTTDTLTLAAGSNVTITTTAASDTVTIAATDTNTMGSGFTVSATTDSNATTITQGDDLMFAAGTGITCETTADGTVTISCTVTDTNTQLSEEQVEDFVGGMVTGNTETGISVTYEDGDGTLDFVVSDTTVAGDSGSTGITPGDTLTIAGGTNATTAMSGDTLTVNVDDAFLKNDADDTTSGKITAAGYAISAVVTESGTSRTLAASDNGKVIVCTNGSATTITVPASLDTGFAVTVIQAGAGQITFSASSTTINNRQSHTKTAGQHARVGLVQTSSDTYNLGGDTAS
tara:strand:+ start:2877 stop:7730 length:4854 start_codon:yes stop_codon:yes gene_type:complete